MPSTAEPMIAQVQQEFQDLVSYVTGPASGAHSAYEVERTLFRRVLANLSSRRDIRAVILTGSGDKAFCAGADLRERLNMPEDQVRAFIPLIRGANRLDWIACDVTNRPLDI